MTTGQTSVGTGSLRWDRVGKPQPATAATAGSGRLSPGRPAPKGGPRPRSDGYPSVPSAPPSRPWGAGASESVTALPENTPIVLRPRRPRQAVLSKSPENQASNCVAASMGSTSTPYPGICSSRFENQGPCHTRSPLARSSDAGGLNKAPVFLLQWQGRTLVDDSIENGGSTCCRPWQPAAAPAGRAAPAHSQDGSGDSAGGEVGIFRVLARVLAGCMGLYLKFARRVAVLSRRALATAIACLRAALPILLTAFVLGLGIAAGVQAGRYKPVNSPPAPPAARAPFSEPEEEAIAATGTLQPSGHSVNPGETQKTPETRGDEQDDLAPAGQVRIAGYGWVTAADGALYHSVASRGKAARGIQTRAEPSDPVGGPEGDDWTAPSPTASPQPPSRKEPTVEQLDLEWPVRGWISSSYGPRDSRMHYGIDIAAPFGAPVKAAAAGRVVFAGWYGSYGKTVIVRHRPDVVTLYAHLSSATAKAGQTVAKGAELGRCGNTGHSKGPHLHFEIRINGSPVDPLPFLD